MEPREQRAPATAASAETRELAEPAPPADLVDQGGLSGQQLAFFQALAEQDGRLAGWYLGARITLSTTKAAPAGGRCTGPSSPPRTGARVARKHPPQLRPRRALRRLPVQRDRREGCGW